MSLGLHWKNRDFELANWKSWFLRTNSSSHVFFPHHRRRTVNWNKRFFIRCSRVLIFVDSGRICCRRVHMGNRFLKNKSDTWVRRAYKIATHAQAKRTHFSHRAGKEDSSSIGRIVILSLQIGNHDFFARTLLRTNSSSHKLFFAQTLLRTYSFHIIDGTVNWNKRFFIRCSRVLIFVDSGRICCRRVHMGNRFLKNKSDTWVRRAYKISTHAEAKRTHFSHRAGKEDSSSIGRIVILSLQVGNHDFFGRTLLRTNSSSYELFFVRTLLRTNSSSHVFFPYHRRHSKLE